MDNLPMAVVLQRSDSLILVPYFLPHGFIFLPPRPATYLLRFGGLLLADWLPSKGRFKLFIDALPGTILISLVAPDTLSAGLWGCIAAVCTAVLTLKTKNVFLTMSCGMLIIALARLN